MTPPEIKLWVALRGSKLEGLKFRRQHPFGPYTLDFYCEAIRLAVEVDGLGHGLGDQPIRDARRDAWLRSQGVETLRIPALDVLRNFDAVLHGLAALAHERRLDRQTVESARNS